MPRLLLVLTVTSCTLFGGCASEPGADTDDSGDHPELKRMYDADQASRSPGESEEIDWRALMREDSLRRVRVHEMLDSNLVRTSGDYYHAAMIFQHGNDTTAARLAHELAEKAVEIDSTNSQARWMVAAAWDRYLMRKGEPQWYGTQFVRNPPSDPWRLYDIDTTRVTDADRARFGVPPLSEARARVRRMNER